MRTIDSRTVILVVTPLIAIAVLWGESQTKLNAMERPMVSQDQLSTIKLEITYIKKAVDYNSTKLDKLLEDRR